MLSTPYLLMMSPFAVSLLEGDAELVERCESRGRGRAAYVSCGRRASSAAFETVPHNESYGSPLPLSVFTVLRSGHLRDLFSLSHIVNG